MSNPYAPPEARGDFPRTARARERTLRWLGASAIAYLLVSTVWRGFPDPGTSVLAVALLGAFLYGFLRGGRKFHLGTALFMGISIPTQAYFMSRAIAHPERLPIPLSPHPWLEFAVAIIPHAMALVCASALAIRAVRAGDPPAFR